MEALTILQKIFIFGIPILFAITLHEASHGYVALKFGDPTAKELGRITMNPLKHIDPVGTIIVPAILALSTGFVFGWAKPVPVNPARLRRPKAHMAIVAAAGPLSNFLMTIFWVLLLKMSIWLIQNDYAAGLPFLYMCKVGISINLVLMVLNLLPIPPLDGSKIAVAFLPPPLDRYYDKAALFGLILVVGLMLTGILAKILLPMVNGLQQVLLSIFNIS